MTDLSFVQLAFAFSLGTATFFAPCAFPLLPGYVAYYLGQGGGNDGSDRSGASDARDGNDSFERPLAARLRRAGAVGLLTSLGFFVVYAILAGVVLAVGTRALANISVLELVVGALLIVLGVGMALGWLQPSQLHIPLPERRRSAGGFFAFGVVYAAAAAGCTAPLFIAVALNALSGGPVTAIATLAAYAAGMSVLMIGVTLLSALGRQALLGRISRNAGRISRAAGVVLVIAGAVQIYFFLFEFDGLSLLGLG